MFVWVLRCFKFDGSASRFSSFAVAMFCFDINVESLKVHVFSKNVSIFRWCGKWTYNRKNHHATDWNAVNRCAVKMFIGAFALFDKFSLVFYFRYAHNILFVRIQPTTIKWSTIITDEIKKVIIQTNRAYDNNNNRIYDSKIFRNLLL